MHAKTLLSPKIRMGNISSIVKIPTHTPQPNKLTKKLLLPQLSSGNIDILTIRKRGIDSK